MQIQDYLASLLPSFEADRVKKDILTLREELKNTTLPAYSAAADNFKRVNLIAKMTQDYDKRFQQIVKVDVRGNYVIVTNEVMHRLAGNLDALEGLVDRYFANDVVAKGLTFLKANLIQYLEACSFALRYGRKLLLWTYQCETNAAKKDVAAMGQELTEYERNYLAKNAQHFANVIRILSGKAKELETAIEQCPDVVITAENVPVLQRTMGLAKTDPFKFNLIPVKLNPIYHIRMAIAEYQVKCYKTAIEEKRTLEYQLMALENARTGKKDPKLEEAIEYNQNRLQKMNVDIQRMEEEYA